MALLAAAAMACLAVAPGCKRPAVGAPTKAAQAAEGARIRITGATIDGTGHVIAAVELTEGGAPVATAAAARALKPTFTLAALSPHPVDGLPAWKSLVLTGGQTATSLPPGGPGTPPAAVLAGVRQPGGESDGALAGDDGAFTYRFATALPAGFDPAQTLRVGVWLLGNGTAEGTSTFDLRPAGGAPAPRDTVLDENCQSCHARVVSPWGAVGVRMCLTCHTWQNTDPDTVDPAALHGSTAATDPNPLELGRMVHLIHRGKWIPVLYSAAAGSGVAPPLPSATVPPLPFLSSRTSGATAANPPVVGRKYAIVGLQSRERVFARVVERRDNNQPAKVAVAGVIFPRDLRDCGACHAGAPQEYEVVYAISRRTCYGCHPEAWFAPPNADGTSSIVEPAPAVHFAHTGGPQADDTRCAGCHVAATATQPKVYAPIAEAHVVPRNHRASSKPRLEIVSVANLVPGGAPTVRFKLTDRVGPLSPPGAPTPADDTGTPPSPVPRKMYSLRLAFQGPTFPDYEGVPIASSDAGSGNPNPLTLVADADGAFTYTFVSKVPDWASGTWSVVIEGRRRAATTYYDVATDTFRWPYTGETVTESPDNVIAYVDTAAGTWPGGGDPVPRRRVVSQQKCLRCHLRFESHGSNRHEVEDCVTCHTPGRTDWEGRPKWPAGAPLAGNVNLGATFDNLEERSVQFKVVIHRIHTGAKRGGTATLELARPYSGNGTSASFREGIFPNDLANCTLCHEGRSYHVDAVPPEAPPARANESATNWHEGEEHHAEGEPVTPAITAACLGCHATGHALSQAAQYTVDGVEQCTQCHVRGALAMDVAHGLAPLGATQVSSSFSEIEEKILVPRCASAACHGGNPPAAFPRLDAGAAYDAMLEVPSQQASMDMVEPYEPGKSYLVLKLRNEGGAVGGIGTPMPIGDALLDPSEVAAVEAWIAAGAPRD